MNCPELLQPACKHMVESAWAFVAHEKLSTVKPQLGLFHPDNPMAKQDLDARLAHYSKLGRSMDPTNPLGIVERF